MNRDLWKEIAWMATVIVMLLLFLVAWTSNRTSDMIAAGILAVLCDGRLFKRSVLNESKREELKDD